MDKNTYIVVSIQEDGKNYAYVIKHHNSNNLTSALKIKGIKAANICDTKKEAEKTATYWNECYKKNGTYMFDEPQF